MKLSTDHLRIFGYYGSKVVMVALCVLPALLLFLLINKYGVDVPFWDEWSYVNFLDKVFSRGIGVDDFFAQHNESRPAFFRLILLLSAIMGHWNRVHEMFAQIIITIGTYILFIYFGIETFRKLKIRNFGWLFVVPAFLLFSPSQSELWFTGGSHCWSLQNAFAVAWTFIFFRSEGRPAIFFIVICIAVIGVFIQSPMWSVWPLGFLILGTELYLFPKERRSNAWRLLFWSMACLALGLFYFHNYSPIVGHPSLTSGIEKPIELIKYFLAFLGNPLGQRHLNTSIFMGMFVFCLFTVTVLYWSWRGNLSIRNVYVSISPWIILGLYSIINAIIVAIGRVGWGPEQALSGRYIALSQFVWIAVAMLLYLTLAQYTRLACMKVPEIFIRVVYLPFLFFLLIFVIGTGLVSRNYIIAEFTNRTVASDALLSNSDCKLLNFLFPWPEQLADFSKILRKHELSLFHKRRTLAEYEILDDLQATHIGNIDTCFVDNNCFRIDGWAIDLNNQCPAKKVFMVRDKTIVACGTPFLPRLDVARFFNYPGYTNSGWQINLSKDINDTQSRFCVYALGKDNISLRKIGELIEGETCSVGQ